METSGVLWCAPVAVDDIPEAGLHREIEASAEVRAALARLANVREVLRASAVFDLTRRGAGVHVAGQVSARVGQTCVVTLEAIECDVNEAVDLLFAPLPAREFGAAGEERSDSDEDLPEPLVGGKVDLGAIATEFLVLGVDPYPRKAGAEFSSPKAADDDGARPFAALEALRKRPGGGRS